MMSGVSSERWLKILETDALPEGEMREARCDKRLLCAVRHGGKLSVFDDVCPHQGSPLSTGWLYEGLVVCPWHGWAYEPVSGRPSSGLGASLVKHEVQERPDGIYVRLADGEPDLE